MNQLHFTSTLTLAPSGSVFWHEKTVVTSPCENTRNHALHASLVEPEMSDLGLAPWKDVVLAVRHVWIEEYNQHC